MTRNSTKICAIICEYNPFHNGHLYQLQLARKLSRADVVLCIMSGNFVQRGEAAILDKYTRAYHAVQGGADIVIELPTVFATSNAELFAKGAIKLLSSIPNVTTLCFGAENDDKTAFLQAATLLNDEPPEVSEKIKSLTASGLSFPKARAAAWKEKLPIEFFSTPNNILGIEYTKAILASHANIDILPIKRMGRVHTDETLENNFSSASAIRKAIACGLPLLENLPKYTANDLPTNISSSLDTLEKYALLNSSEEKLRNVCDCTEGLEHAFKKAANNTSSIEKQLTSARYTSARIRRIALQNLLNIDEKLIRACLNEPLYLQLLAVNTKNEAALSLTAESKYPLLTRKKDTNILNGVAKLSKKADDFADGIYGLLYPSAVGKKTVFV